MTDKPDKPDDLAAKLDRSETAILESAYAVDRLLAKMADYDEPELEQADGTVVRLGPPCPTCGRPLQVDVMLHPNDSGTLLGVARGFKVCDCQSG